jgi:hypothetical protein
VANHRYWRVFIRKARASDGYTQFAELEFRASAGGSDTTSGGTAISSGSIQAGTAAGVFANDGTTGFVQWSGDGGVYCGYDYGASSGNWQDIVEIANMGALATADRTLGEGDVQYSDDGSTWTTAWSISYTTAYVSGTNVIFTKPSAVASRYWRVRALSTWSTYGFSIAEMEMRTSVGGTDQCSGGTASALSYFDGTTTPANGFDNSNSTIYNQGGSPKTDSEYLSYDFGSGVTKAIVEIAWRTRTGGNSFFAPRTGIVESSTDGINWLARWTFSLVCVTDDAWLISTAPASKPVGGSTFRIWGIKATSVQSGSNFGLREAELRATVGGSDMCSGGAGMAQAPFDSSNLPSYVFDNTSAEYGSSASLPSIVAYDFGYGNEKAVPAQISMTARSSSPGQSATGFDLVYSTDNETFTTQQSFTSPATWASVEQRLFAVTVSASGRRRQIVN